jgi:rubrerythrin
MDIYEYAMQMEKDGENYYRDLVKKISNKGLQKILGMLADAEVAHFDTLQKIKNSEKAQVADTPILSNVKNIFVKMKEERDTAGIHTTQIGLYKKAQEIEKKSQKFYLDRSGEVNEPSHKDLFLKIAEEEKKHYFILENIIDFVSRPYTWLEDAEWYHFDEY